MLTSIRTVFAKGIARVILIGLVGLLIVSFGIFGIQDVFRGFRSTEVARIGDTKIPVEVFQRQYNLQLQNLSRQFGQPLTPDQARAFGLDKQVLGRMVTDAALDERTTRYGLQLSLEKVAAMVMEDPTFQAGTGRFNRDYFNAVIRQNGLTEAAFFDQQRKVYQRAQLAEAIGGDVAVSRILREALARYGTETRSIEYFVIGESALPSMPEPDAAKLAAFFEERKAQFGAPEYRKFSYMALAPETVVATTQVTDADARSEYDARLDTYTTPERREVQQIAFPNADEAKAAADRLASKAITFDALVAERKLQASDVSLGLVSKKEMLDPVIADAAFGLALNTPSGVVAGKLTTVILQVTKIEPQSVKAFDEVKDEIKRKLALDRAGRVILDLQGKIEDERAGGASLAEIAPKFGLTVTEVAAVDSTGLDESGASVSLPAAVDLVRGVFASDPGTETTVIDAREAGFIWYEVQGVTPARERTLDEARAAVTAAFVADEKARALRERADALVKELRTGKTLEDAAKSVGTEVKQAWDLRRGQAAQGLSGDAVAAIFTTAVNDFGSAVGASAGERVVFKLTGNAVPAFDPGAEAAKAAERQLASQMGQDVLNQYVLRSQDELGLTINQQLLNQAIGAQN